MKPRLSRSVRTTWTRQDSLQCLEKIRTCGAIVVDHVPFAEQIIAAGADAGMILACTPQASQYKVHPVVAAMDPKE